MRKKSNAALALLGLVLAGAPCRKRPGAPRRSGSGQLDAAGED